MQHYSKEMVHAFLKHHAVAILSTVSPDNTPCGSAIYYIADKNLNFYFLSFVDSEKVQNIKQNNHAALTIADADLLITIQAKGIIHTNNDPLLLAKLAEDNAKEQYGFKWPPPLAKIDTEKHSVLYKFEPTWLRVADFSHSDDPHQANTSIFHQII